MCFKRLEEGEGPKKRYRAEKKCEVVWSKKDDVIDDAKKIRKNKVD